MQKISQFILVSMVVGFLWGCATTLPTPHFPEEHCSKEQTPPVNSTSCDCDNDKMLAAKKILDTNQELLEELKTQVSTTQEQLDILTAKNSELKETVASLTKKNEENQLQINTLRTDNENLTNQIKQLEQQLSDTKMPSVGSNSPQQDENLSDKIYKFKKNK